MAKETSEKSRTTAAIRRAIQQSPEGIRILALRYGINPKTVAKWRHRESVSDRRAGPRNAKSSVLTIAEEALVVAFRQHIQISLDDCLLALQPFIPQLTRSSLHRCLQRHGISRLPRAPNDRDNSQDKVVFDVGIGQIEINGHRFQLLTAIERASKYAFATLQDATNTAAAVDFLAMLAGGAVKPQRIVVDGSDLLRSPSFERACASSGIELRQAARNQRWSEEKLMRMNRTIAEALLQRADADAAALDRQLAEVVSLYNANCRPVTLSGMTPQQAFGRNRTPTPAAPAGRATESRDKKAAAPIERPTERNQRKRRAPNPASTREAILQAARSCLAHDGPEGLSLAEVARIAGVSRGTAYQHFKTRDQLIAATAEGVSDKLYRAVFGDPAKVTVRPVGTVDVSRITDRLASFAMENPELCRAWLLTVLSSPNPASDPFWRQYQGSTARFAQTDRAQHNIDTEVLSVIMLAGAFLWPVWARAHTQGTRDLPALAHRFAQESLRISMYGNLRSEHYPELAKRLLEEPYSDANR